jgi:hypothetical protein
VTIYVTPKQADAMRTALTNDMNSPQSFDPLYRNCAALPQEILKAGGVTVPFAETPGGLVKAIREAQQPDN